MDAGFEYSSSGIEVNSSLGAVIEAKDMKAMTNHIESHPESNIVAWILGEVSLDQMVFSNVASSAGRKQ